MPPECYERDPLPEPLPGTRPTIKWVPELEDDMTTPIYGPLPETPVCDLCGKPLLANIYYSTTAHNDGERFCSIDCAMDDAESKPVIAHAQPR